MRDTLDGTDGVVFKGFFAVPASGSYRFKMTCDDQCKMKFDKVKSATTAEWTTAFLTPEYKATLTEIATDTFIGGFRNYWDETDITNGNKPTSDWINMSKGDSHYFEVVFVDYGGSDYVNVAV